MYQQMIRHLLEALRWQVDIGADEAIMDTPDPLTASSVVTGKAAIQADQASTTNEMITTTTPSDHTAELDVSSCRHWKYCVMRQKCMMARSLSEQPRKLFLLMAILYQISCSLVRHRVLMKTGRKPFVGVSGQLLNRMLSSIHMPREDVYVTNTICGGSSNRTSAQETAQFIPILRRHIQLVAPKLLVCLGGAAAKALLSTDMGILKLRGNGMNLMLVTA